MVLDSVTRIIGGKTILDRVSVDVADGEFVVMVGPSGCGKSTLLRLVAGLDPVSGGRIAIDGTDVTRRGAGQRNVAMVFQSYALYPHMTVFENMAFPLEMEKRPKAEIRRRVEEIARTLQLETRLKDKPPQLSGGQRQRVAIGRAIVRQPGIFLFDEPLSNLDAALRANMRTELIRLHRQLGATMIYVTHDQLEAMTMADRIVVLNAGRVEQIGSPMDLYQRPDSRFVASFIGSPSMNMFDVTATQGGLETRLFGSVSLPGANLAPGQATLGVRPESIRLGPAPEGMPAISTRMKVAVVERLGLHTIATLDKGDDQLVAVFTGDQPLALDSEATLHVPAEAIYLFDAAGRRVAPR